MGNVIGHLPADSTSPGAIVCHQSQRPSVVLGEVLMASEELHQSRTFSDEAKQPSHYVQHDLLTTYMTTMFGYALKTVSRAWEFAPISMCYS